MGATTPAIPPRDTLLMDRFAWTRSDGWIDLATDRRVLPVEHGDARVSTAAWMARCTRLEELWCSRLVPMIDHAVIDDRRVEVHDGAPDTIARAPPHRASSSRQWVSACGAAD